MINCMLVRDKIRNIVFMNGIVNICCASLFLDIKKYVIMIEMFAIII